MRIPQYLSPSSLSTWEKDGDEFYLRYLADVRPPRPAQTKPMSVGSAFDAYIKSYLYELIMGSSKGTDYDFETLFEHQVDPVNRDFARSAGKKCLEAYICSGTMVEVTSLLKNVTEVCFEIECIGAVNLDGTHKWTKEADRGLLPLGSVPLLGKPDMRFRLGCGILVTLDWKVNGYCSKSGAATKRGYVRYRDGFQGPPFSKNHGTKHKDTVLSEVYGGFFINVGEPFENYYPEHAAQLSTYSWLNGAKVGDQSLVVIHQLAWKDGICRIADYRGHVSSGYQHQLFTNYRDLWLRITENRVFDEPKRQLLEKMAKQSVEAMGEDDEMEKLFIDLTRKDRY